MSTSVKASDNPRRSYMSYIDTLVDEQILLIYTPIFKGQVIQLPTFEGYKPVFYVQTGLYRIDGKVLVNLVENSVVIVKTQIGHLESTQRREFYRVTTTFEFTYTRPMPGADETGDLPLYPVTGENISGGGMCFLSLTPFLEEGSTYCTLSIKNQMTAIEAIILHTESPENSRELYGMYEYRAWFYLCEKRDQEIVMQHVLAKQREILFRCKMQFKVVDSDDKNRGILRRR